MNTISDLDYSMSHRSDPGTSKVITSKFTRENSPLVVSSQRQSMPVWNQPSENHVDDDSDDPDIIVTRLWSFISPSHLHSNCQVYEKFLFSFSFPLSFFRCPSVFRYLTFASFSSMPYTLFECVLWTNTWIISILSYYYSL